MSDAVLIVGGGATGLAAALACADAGARAIVVERAAVVGGRRAAAMTSRAESGEGAGLPRLERLARHPDIEILTLAELEGLEGRPGSFTASIRERARFVTDTCTRCNHCHAVCPVVVPNEFDEGLTFRKAIHTPLVETLPDSYVVDIEHCLNRPPNYLPCQRCVEVCDDDSIHFDVPLDHRHERHVGAVILAPGFEPADRESLAALGYGVHPDVVSAEELERMLESPGPTGGFVVRPSNEAYPESLLWVLDETSAFAADVVAHGLGRLTEQGVERIAVLILASPSEATELEALRSAAARVGAEIVWGATQELEVTDEGALSVRVSALPSGRMVEARYDLVVLSSAPRPAEGLAELARVAGVELSERGDIASGGDTDTAEHTCRPGIFVAGGARGPRNLADSLGEAHLAAAAALDLLDARLLRGDLAGAADAAAADAAIPGGPGAPAAPAVSEAEQVRRIEQMLHALMKLGES